MSGKTGIKVYAPAAIGNFSIGLSNLSVAVEQPGDEIIATLDNSIEGVHLETLQGYKSLSLKDNKHNSAVLAGQLVLEHFGSKQGIRLKLHKHIPLQSGLSSNAASAVAGAFAVNELLNKPLQKNELLSFAEEAASRFNSVDFPSQVAAILFGGIILYKNKQRTSFQKVYAPHGMQITLVIPGIHYNEQEKLNFLRNKFSVEEQISFVGNSTSAISALYTSDYDLLSTCFEDNILNSKLAPFYNYFEPISKLVKSEGGMGCGFAGLGPVLYIVSPNTLVAEEISTRIPRIFSEIKLEHQLINTQINLNGVYKF